MTITLTSTNPTASTILCDGSAHAGTPTKHVGPLGNMRTEVEYTIRPKRPIGAADETPLDGGHAVWPFAFSTWVEFSTLAAAEQFCDTWPASLPRINTTLLLAYPGGTQITRANAILKKCTCQQYGIAVQVDYLFQTTRPVDTTPAP